MRKYLYLPLLAVTLLCMGLAALNCGDNEDPKECETNEICIEKHGAGWWCDHTVWECKPCIPICEGKCCGGDGCGGTCTDNCTAPEFCNTQTCGCISGCQNDGDCTTTQCCINNTCTEMSCGTLECGNDPVCSKSCGTCTAPETCSNGTCVGPCTTDTDCADTQCCINSTCTPMACGALECGPDPTCSKECGPCVAPQVCSGGQCVTVGDGKLGDPCAFGDVNVAAGACNAGLECLGINPDGVSGECPGGLDSECTDLLEEWNRDCVTGNCGASFCSQECEVGDTCPTDFVPLDVSGTCMCVPGQAGDRNEGEPCEFVASTYPNLPPVNEGTGNCRADLHCIGLPPLSDNGLCPGGSGTECTGLYDSWNPDCVDGNCGASFCAPECDASGNCDEGWASQDVGGTCLCLPTDVGTSQVDDPCPFSGGVNGTADACAAGLACLGFPPDGTSGTCPGGQDSECTSLIDLNPDCVSGNCGGSLCCAECDASGNCETGYLPQDVSGTCYCVPGEAGTSQAGDPCPFTGGINDTANACAAGLACLGTPADGTSGTCPGGNPTECTDIPANQNPDCVGGNCGASFCAEPCDASGNCPVGFVGEDVGGTCYCVPS